MDKNLPDASEIKVYPGVLHVRNRPEMYIGVDKQQGLAYLLEGLMEWAASQARNGVSVSVAENGAVTVRDDGPGISVDKRKNSDQTVLEVFFTQLGCGVQEPVVALPVICALSEYLFVATTQNDALGWPCRYSMEFAAGEAKTPLSSKKTHQGGTRITFKPDPTIFGEARLNIEQAKTVAEKVREKYPNIMVIVSTQSQDEL